MNGYLYDTHTHTAEVSRCGHLPAAQVVDLYAQYGYSGLVVTDHLHMKYLSRIDTQGNWDTVIDHFLTGYKASKRRGDEVGLDIILGAELRFPESNSDYLIYGIDEQWLRSNPYLCCMSAQEFYDKFCEQVLIIQAHPFRDGGIPTQEGAVHGVEIINTNPRHDGRNDMALELCRRHPEYYRQCGCDTHRVGDAVQAGVLLPERVRDSYAYKAMIEGMRFQLWCPQYQTIVDEDKKLREKDGLLCSLE